MYARLVRFTLNAGKHAAAQAIANELAPQIAAQPGCEGVTVFADESGEAGLFVLWDSEERAEAASNIIWPQLDKHLSGNISAPPDARLFTVLL